MHTLVYVQLVGGAGRAGAVNGSLLDAQTLVGTKASGAAGGGPGAAAKQCHQQQQRQQPRTIAVHIGS